MAKQTQTSGHFYFSENKKAGDVTLESGLSDISISLMRTRLKMGWNRSEQTVFGT